MPKVHRNVLPHSEIFILLYVILLISLNQSILIIIPYTRQRCSKIDHIYSFRFALDVPEYFRDLEAATSTLVDGYWVGSVNSHGINATKYTLFTIWHIAADKITVFYANFMRNITLQLFYDETMRLLMTINIVPIVVLQDGEGKLDATLYPIFHLTNHGYNYLTAIRMSEIRNGRFNTVYSGKTLSDLISLNTHLRYRLKEIATRMKNVDRFENDLMLNPPFTDTMMTFLENLYDRFKRSAQVPYVNELTFDTAQHFFQMINCFQTRMSLTDDQAINNNTRDIIHHLDELIYVCAGRAFLPTIPPYTNVKIITQFRRYHELLTNNPLLPYEVFILSVEYECAIIYLSGNLQSDGHHYLLKRIKDGTIYTGNFTFWCGSTRKIVEYPQINIESYRHALVPFLPRL